MTRWGWPSHIAGPETDRENPVRALPVFARCEGEAPTDGVGALDGIGYISRQR